MLGLKTLAPFRSSLSVLASWPVVFLFQYPFPLFLLPVLPPYVLVRLVVPCRY